MEKSVCERCKHYAGGAKCKAFPDGIPRQLLEEHPPHTKPFPGDHGIYFELKEGEVKKPYSDPRWWDNPMGVASTSPCVYCIHYLGESKCKAFPEGIDPDVLFCKPCHDHPLPGDRGYQFQTRDPRGEEAMRACKDYIAYCEKYGI